MPRNHAPVLLPVASHIVLTRRAVAGEAPESVNKPKGGSTELVFKHNLQAGGTVAPVMGDGDLVADPRFINASIEPRQADFRLRPDGPAQGGGRHGASHLPLDDLSSALRPVGRKPDIGAISR